MTGRDKFINFGKRDNVFKFSNIAPHKGIKLNI